MMSMSSTPSARGIASVKKRTDGVRRIGLTHALASEDIREPSEKQLPEDGADGGGDLDAEVLVRAQRLVLRTGSDT